MLFMHINTLSLQINTKQTLVQHNKYRYDKSGLYSERRQVRSA